MTKVTETSPSFECSIYCITVFFHFDSDRQNLLTRLLPFFELIFTFHGLGKEKCRPSLEL